MVCVRSGIIEAAELTLAPAVPSAEVSVGAAIAKFHRRTVSAKQTAQSFFAFANRYTSVPDTRPYFFVTV